MPAHQWAGYPAHAVSLTRAPARIPVPVGDGKLLAGLHRRAEVMAEVQVDGVIQVTARVEARVFGKLRREGIAVDIVP